MRVAMGLALNEGGNKNEWARAFYDILSTMDFMNSTPTLFNSGTTRSQLASCFLTTVSDDLDGIYDAIKENAHLQKYAGGLGNDWTNIRALGSWIKGTNGKSQGVVPFLKVVNDTAVAVNQGGKRKGAVCAYLETWHLDIEEFLDLRKNTGDDRRRTHDMNTANWIPDLFMKRVQQKGMWTLVSPSDAPHLHDLYGKAFEVAYLEVERKTQSGEIKLHKQIPALDLWRKMLSMLFETGHPWITFKDPCNIRSPQQHVGVVHSSNLCTEITLNTSEEETAVCNIGSISLPAHVDLVNGKLVINHAKMEKTIRIAMRMLDNVIDINHYASAKAKTSNLRHRPVGLGMMGFQDVLQLGRIPFASNEAVEFADESMEAICYYAYKASMEMAKERGQYSTFEGSLWSQGILPHDSQKLLLEARGAEYFDMDMTTHLGWDKWDALRKDIRTNGMRNSNCVAIAPTATISNIIDVSACIEPTFKNLFVKSNLSGEFTIINKYLVRDLKGLGLWDEVMIADLKHFDGDVSQISRIPQEVRDIYATAFDIHPKWGIYQTARRQKWIDQAVSHNVYMKGASGKMLNETYTLAWTKGLKTTYYLRTMGATAAEKSTGRGGELNAVQASPAPVAAPAPVAEAVPQQRIDDKLAAVAAAAPAISEDDIVGQACFLRPGDDGFEECEACQ
jgi:ribonucleoside-diphosphate reductase alpha chain